jgi:hypothetical protein
MNRLLRDYARAHEDRISIVDLAALLCPSGHQPCRRRSRESSAPPRDGNHFELDTAGVGA